MLLTDIIKNFRISVPQTYPAVSEFYAKVISGRGEIRTRGFYLAKVAIYH